jgi:hypothetical protein
MFTLSDLFKIDIFQDCKGMSIYKNVLILWDEDFDTTIHNFIDSLGIDAKSLCAAMERKGILNLLWHDFIPEKYQENKEVLVNKDYFFEIDYYDDCLSEEEQDNLDIDYEYPTEGSKNEKEQAFHDSFWNDIEKKYGYYAEDLWIILKSISLSSQETEESFDLSQPFI